MPAIRGVTYVGLSVRDVRGSASWYRELLGLDVVRENLGGEHWEEILLKEPKSGLEIGLLQHRTNPGDPFSEFRTGLDHLEFEVASLKELEAWNRRLDTLGIEHSGIKGHILTFRDPDNIQLEFFSAER